MSKPWKTSADIISSVKKRIAVPIAQDAFEDEDILEFANSELFNSQVPSVMQYHQEYFVYRKTVPLETNKVRYEIPDRAIGMRLRDVFYEDQSGNLIELAQINADNQDLYQLNSSTNLSSGNYCFYLENNYVVLPITSLNSPTGSLVLTFFLRPNNLVSSESVAICESFQREIQIGSIQDGDQLFIDDITFTASSSTSQISTSQYIFDITSGSPSIIITELADVINLSGVLGDVGPLNNGAELAIPDETRTITCTFASRSLDFSSTPDAQDNLRLYVTTYMNIVFEDDIPDNIVKYSYIDFLQTKAGHKIYNYDIFVNVFTDQFTSLPIEPVNGNTLRILETDVPDEMVIGDYIASQYESIIPGIPSDLHDLLIERTCALILGSQGDTEMLAQMNDKIQRSEITQGTMIDQRVDGAVQKVFNRNGLLRVGKYNYRNIS